MMIKREKVKSYTPAEKKTSLRDVLGVTGLCLACVAVVAITLVMSAQKGSKGQISGTNGDSGSVDISQLPEDGADDFAEVSAPDDEPTDSAGADAENGDTPEKAADDSTAVNEDDVYDVQSVTPVQAQPITFAPPLKGKILKPQSNTALVYSETLDDYRLHTGVDIGAKMGTTVCAAADGVVEEVKNDIRFGYTIVVSHSGGIKSVYSNLTGTQMVKVGKDLKKGDPIGMVGDSAICETADEAHLHFEMIKDGEYVDPVQYFENSSSDS